MATALRTATWPSASPMQFFGPEENGKKRGAPDTGSTAASGSDQRSGLKVRASGPQLDAELLITNRQGKTVTPAGMRYGPTIVGRSVILWVGVVERGEGRGGG